MKRYKLTWYSSKGEKVDETECTSRLCAMQLLIKCRLVEFRTAFAWYVRTGEVLEPCRFSVSPAD